MRIYYFNLLLNILLGKVKKIYQIFNCIAIDNELR